MAVGYLNGRIPLTGVFNNNIFKPARVRGSEKITDGKVHIYPNPARDLVTVHTPWDSQNKVALFNITGTLVFSEQFTNQTTLTVGNLPSGIYLVQITAPGKPTFMKKMVVQ